MNVLELFATLSLDSKKYDEALNNAKNNADGAGSKIGGAFSKLGKVALAGLGAAEAGVTALVKSAVSSYGDYEQLVGGVETLFSSLDGTVSAASDVLANAANAYKTAGMSANDYMETVTSFSAALVSSLEGDYSKAAKVSDMAITDMADNANKMGTSLDAIQVAYQGFAKQNYTMLDNLKLGYGGTKSEMERLLADAEKFSGVKYDISNLNDVYEAIHVVQTELGISGISAEEAAEAVRTGAMTEEEALAAMGTTAREAATTIQGSMGMMKSAWQNLVAGFANPDADIGKLINNFVDSAGTAMKNLIPAITNALSGIGKVVTNLAPIISAELPKLVTALAPGLLDAAAQMILGLANGLLAALPALVPVVVDVVLKIVDTLIENVDMLIDAAVQIIIALAAGLIQALPKLLAKAPEIISALVGAIIGAVSQLAQAAGSIISTLAQGIGARISTIIGKGKEVLVAFKNGVVSAVGSLASAGLSLVQGIWNGISNGLGWIKGKIQGWVGNVTSFIKSLFGIHSPSTVMRDQVGKFLALGIGEGFTREMTSVEKMMQNAMPDLTSNIDVNGNYNGYGYGSGAFGGMAINGDVYITVEGAGRNAEEIGRDLYKMLVRQGGVAYAY